MQSSAAVEIDILNHHIEIEVSSLDLVEKLLKWRAGWNLVTF